MVYSPPNPFKNPCRKGHRNRLLLAYWFGLLSMYPQNETNITLFNTGMGCRYLCVVQTITITFIIPYSQLVFTKHSLKEVERVNQVVLILLWGPVFMVVRATT